MLPIRHIEPFLHRYRNHFCCIHPYSFCEAISLYAINFMRSIGPTQITATFQLPAGGRIVSPRLWRVLFKLFKLYAAFERAEAKSAYIYMYA